MKIMFNCMGLGKGGAERVINILANSLSKDNNIKILTNIKSNPEYEFNKNILITSLTNSNNSIIRKIRRISPIPILKMKKEIISFNPDVIISFLPEPSFRILFLKKTCKKIKNIPIIVSVRNDPNTEYKNGLFFYIMKKLYPYSDELVLQTNDAKKYFEEKINYKGIVIPNPVSDLFLIDRFQGIRKKVIVAIGRLEYQKNYYNMIDAFEMVNSKHNDYILNIYGDGYLKKNIEEYIKEKKLTNSIILKGKTNNVVEAIYDATAFVMSSDYEGMPNSLLEAACVGVPCISTDCPCGGPRDILQNGIGGILVKTNDSKEMADAICRVIENPKIATEMSTISSEKKDKYKKETIIQEWEKIIKKIVNGSAKNDKS